jgi:hypothetical protein
MYCAEPRQAWGNDLDKCCNKFNAKARGRIKPPGGATRRLHRGDADAPHPPAPQNNTTKRKPSPSRFLVVGSREKTVPVPGKNRPRPGFYISLSVN